MSPIQNKPIIHASDHLPGHADPIPGLLVTTGGGTYEDAVRNTDLTAWWRLGDTFTFASTVADAMVDSAAFDADSPRNLDYAEASSTGRPTLQVTNTELGADDDGAVEFTSASYSAAHRFFSNTTAVADVTQFGVSGDLARTVTCWVKITSNPGLSGLYGPVVGRWGMDGSGSDNVGWVIEAENYSCALRFRAKPSIGTTYTIAGPTLAPDTWHHVTVTWDGATWTMYVDGLFVDDVAGASAPVGHSGGHGFAVGYADYDSGATHAIHTFYGSVDDVAFYKRVLTPGEIAAIAGGGAPDTSNAVTSIAAEGETPLTGDVTLSEGTNVTLTQVGQDIEITATGGGGGGPTGAAGGVLDGSYPNPGLAASVAGAGLAEASDVLSVNVDGSTLEISSDTLRVKADGITAGQIAAGAVGSSELADTAVTPASYGDATHVATFTVDQDGRLTAAGNTAITASGGTSPADTAGWMPLTTVVGGVPDLVWDATDALIPTYGPF